MTCKLLKFLVQIEQAYEKLDLKEVLDLSVNFLSKDLAEYYLPVSRDRLLMREGSPEHISSQMLYSKILVAVLQALAPILPLTSQEAYSHMIAANPQMLSKDLLPEHCLDGDDITIPPTIYQLKVLDLVDLRIDPKFLAKYDTFDTVD